MLRRAISSFPPCAVATSGKRLQVQAFCMLHLYISTAFYALSQIKNMNTIYTYAQDSRFFESAFLDASISWLDSWRSGELSRAFLRVLRLPPVSDFNSGKSKYTDISINSPLLLLTQHAFVRYTYMFCFYL